MVAAAATRRGAAAVAAAAAAAAVARRGGSRRAVTAVPRAVTPAAAAWASSSAAAAAAHGRGLPPPAAAAPPPPDRRQGRWWPAVAVAAAAAAAAAASAGLAAAVADAAPTRGAGGGAPASVVDATDTAAKAAADAAGEADEDAAEDPPVVPGVRAAGLPTYTAAEVAAHAGRGDTAGGGDGGAAGAAATVWVTYGAGVYDVTDFVASHPGGDILLRAAGSSLEPHWDMYAQHRQAYVYEVLEEMRVGNLAPADVAANAAARAAERRPDAYANEPVRWDGLRVRSAAPFNAEPPPDVLVASYLTPNGAFYVRNHLPVPAVATGDGADYRLSVAVPAAAAGAPAAAASAAAGRSCVHSLSLADVQALPAVTITAAIQCAGNRRTEMSGHRPVKGGAWDACAISNAAWTGARLTDVLASLGVPDAAALAAAGVRHVVFEGADADAEGGTYGASIPLDVLAAGDVLLAWAMNGEPLPADHGAPLRVVAPGIVGARNVKWVTSIALSAEESHSHWQRRDYKGFCPSVRLEDADYDAAPSIQELPITSAIGDVAVAPDGRSVTARGYAYAGGGRPVVRVDVSADGGETWVAAALTGADGSPPAAARGGRGRDYGWTLWSATLPLPPGGGGSSSSRPWTARTTCSQRGSRACGTCGGC